MAHKTKFSPLEIEGVDDIAFRHRPLPAFAAADEFLEVSSKLDAAGTLDMLVGAGTGVKLDPRKWDVADAALMLKAVMQVVGKSKASDALLSLFEQYSVEFKASDDSDWVALDESSADKIDPSMLPFVAFACLRGSLVPFFNRLVSFGEAMAAKQAKPSTENDETI